jgi:hypothetical protein
MDKLDAVIVDALRSAPLASPPPGLFVAVMGQVSGDMGPSPVVRHRLPSVRRSPSAAVPSFRVSWLDLALSLFGAGLAGVVGLTWVAIPPQWSAYLRMYGLWIVQHTWYSERVVLVWCGLALAALCAGLLAAGLSCARLGICSRRV